MDYDGLVYGLCLRAVAIRTGLWVGVHQNDMKGLERILLLNLQASTLKQALKASTLRANFACGLMQRSEDMTHEAWQ